MLNFLIIGNDKYLTKEVVKNLESDYLLKIDAKCKTQIARALNIKEQDLFYLSPSNIEKFYNLENDKFIQMPIVVSVDETKPFDDFTLKSFHELVQNNLKAKKKRLITELQQIGYNFKYKGTQYLIDVILLLHRDDDIFLNNLQSTLYPIVAEKYGKTMTDIKNCIISATDNMYAECNTEKLKKYFSLNEDERPSIKRVIYTIANKLYQ